MIKVNEYVRTKEGFIYRIENGEEFYADSVDVGIGIIPDVDGIWIDRECLDYIDKRDIVKHSEHLIDLIEVGDIVKIKISEEWVEKQDTIKFVVVGQTYTITEIKECLENGLFKIIQILTKESYMANCYKVGGEDEQIKILKQSLNEQIEEKQVYMNLLEEKE